MKRKTSRAAAAAGSLALLGGALVAGTGPALATPPPNRSWGAAASGKIMLTPVALATRDSGPAVASNANIAGLLATSTITDRASAGGAGARVNGPTVLTLPDHGSLVTSGLRSWCTVSGDDDVHGGATIFSGAITYFRPSDRTIALPEQPAPNTVIILPDKAGKIVLNSQVDGGRRTEAIKAEIDGQLVNLGVSQCGLEG